jgi:hypothetical protein
MAPPCAAPLPPTKNRPKVTCPRDVIGVELLDVQGRGHGLAAAGQGHQAPGQLLAVRHLVPAELRGQPGEVGGHRGHQVIRRHRPGQGVLDTRSASTIAG